MKTIFRKEVAIGLSVLIAIAILIFGINFLKGVNLFKASNYYYATYNNVEGLAESAHVTLNGFNVGQVREIRYDYDHPGNVNVEISLDKSLKLPQGTKALLTSDMLGTASIMLELGKSAEMIPVGDKLISERRPGLMDALSTQLMPAVSQIFPKIDTLLTTVNSLLGDPALKASVQRLDAITADLEATSKSIAQMSKAMAPLPGKLNPILTDVKTITGNVGTITSDVSVLTSQMRSLPVDSLLANIQATTANLRTISDELANPNSSLGQLMNDPALYRNINSTVSSLDSLFIDIKKNPKRYISIKMF